MTESDPTPSVLFVCVKNGGKSQMAAGLMSKIACDTVQVYSAGTKPGTAVNDLSAQALAKVGVDITGNTPTLIDPQLVRDVDFVITLGREAQVDPVPGTRFENWDTVEPSERGIDGIERMRLVRDDIAARVADLLDRMQTGFHFSSDLASVWPIGHQMRIFASASTGIPRDRTGHHGGPAHPANSPRWACPASGHPNQTFDWSAHDRPHQRDHRSPPRPQRTLPSA